MKPLPRRAVAAPIVFASSVSSSILTSLFGVAKKHPEPDSPSNSDDSMTTLCQLPKEVIFEIFDHLPLADVGNVALTSEYFRTLVGEWIPTARCLAGSLVHLKAEIPGRFLSSAGKSRT